MNLSNLQPSEGSVNRDGKRLGRGQGSGKGGTAARGHNGAKSRSGYSKKLGFEGGQMPLQRRVPKFGFTNINRKDYKGVSLARLQLLLDSNEGLSEITLDTLVENRVVRKRDLVKILGDGELTSAVKVSVHKYTAQAKKAIELAGGEAISL